MKNALFILSLGLGLCACQPDEKLTVEVPSEPLETFGARYIVPLTEGRDNGEQEIVDRALITRTNLAEFKPVLMRIAQDAYDGKLGTYPDGYTDQKGDPTTFLKRNAESMVENGIPFRVEDLGVSLEVNFKGAVLASGTLLLPEFLDLVWVDPGATLPDRVVARVNMGELKKYHVQQGGHKVSVPEYLASRNYEHYVIRVQAPLDTFGIRTFPEAREIGALIDKGEIYGLKGKHN